MKSDVFMAGTKKGVLLIIYLEKGRGKNFKVGRVEGLTFSISNPLQKNKKGAKITCRISVFLSLIGQNNLNAY